MKLESQNSAIKAHLQSGCSLTGLTALNLFGTMRLSARIHDLKSSGMDILDKWVQIGDKRVKSYYIDMA